MGELSAKPTEGEKPLSQNQQTWINSVSALSLLPPAFGRHLPHQRKARVTDNKTRIGYPVRVVGVIWDYAALGIRRIRWAAGNASVVSGFSKFSVNAAVVSSVVQGRSVSVPSAFTKDRV